ncbi:MAG: membrane protein insertion efficiency factor YidD [Holosporaceae bacterium]|jgi:putative membrane protein insertion efficiency factor|nr:membrane protein insertion efficiency factor YidD [Holosporaceae bacterium]
MQKIAIVFIRFYQMIISPHLKLFQCKFFPTCSEYAIMAIKEFGLWKGLHKTLVRLVKCNPFTSGGVDFPESADK